MNFSQNELGYFPQMPVCDKHLSSELNSDFTLPDYKCEIRRMLSVKATVVPPSEYVSNASAQLDGDIRYKILYLGADGELYSIELNDKYAFKLPLDFGFYSTNPDNLTLICNVNQENVSAKVLGPRKLNVKTKLSLHATGLSPELRSPNLVGSHNSANIEKLISQTECASIIKCSSEPELISDFISVDHSSDSFRVVDCSQTVTITECSVQSSQINVRGEVTIKIICCDDSHPTLPITSTRKIPFTKTIDCDMINSTYECSCFGLVSDEKVNIEENGIGIEAYLTLYVKAQKNDEVSYVADAYSTEKESEVSYSSIKIPVALKATNGNLTQNEVFQLDEIGISRDAKIVDTTALAEANECAIKDGHLVIKGKCDYQIIYCLDGEFASKNVSAPFKYELDCKYANKLSAPANLFVNANVNSAKSRCDAERLFVDCELGFDVFALCENEINLVSEMIFTQARQNHKNELLICYPDREATLWSVAKQYGEPVSAIKKRNSISDTDGTIKRRFLVI